MDQVEMSKRRFQCDPVACGCGSACYSNSLSYPTVSLGDYARLIRHEDIDVLTMDELWLKYGTLTPEPADKQGMCRACLGLLHEPCVFLLRDGCCRVHRDSVRTFLVRHAPAIEAAFQETSEQYYQLLDRLQLSAV